MKVRKAIKLAGMTCVELLDVAHWETPDTQLALDAGTLTPLVQLCRVAQPMF
jgi:hypothetical protein